MEQASQPIILSPATPSELVSRILSFHAHPTTFIVCWPKTNFLDALFDDVQNHQTLDQSQKHALLRAPLMQVAVSRHIHVAFVPTVTHLRCYLAAFSARDLKTKRPPPQTVDLSSHARRAPLLLVYGFLGLHRGASEWSAQGLNTSGAGLVECAARNGLRAAIVEPRTLEIRDELSASLAESVPVVSGSTRRDDGTWTSRVVAIQRVLGRWFDPELEPEHTHNISHGIPA